MSPSKTVLKIISVKAHMSHLGNNHETLKLLLSPNMYAKNSSAKRFYDGIEEKHKCNELKGPHCGSQRASEQQHNI